jgi:uncharacterized Zn finger protein (UPF0148 family)
MKACSNCGVNYVTGTETLCPICKREKQQKNDNTKNGPVFYVKKVNSEPKTNLQKAETMAHKEVKKKKKHACLEKLTPEQYALKYPFQGGSCSGK